MIFGDWKKIFSGSAQNCRAEAPEKCFFFQRKVKYLSHVEVKTELLWTPEKIGAVKSWPKPANA